MTSKLKNLDVSVQNLENKNYDNVHLKIYTQEKADA